MMARQLEPDVQQAPTTPDDPPVIFAAYEALAGTPQPLRMLPIRADSFEMGSPEGEDERSSDEGPQHDVSLSAFWLGATEVTQGQYKTVMGEGTSCYEYMGVSLQGDTLPVQCVTWVEAAKFANALSAMEGLQPAYSFSGEDVSWDHAVDGYRLPTEAEWEYAARAGTHRLWPGAEEESRLCEVANVADGSAKAEFGWSRASEACDDGYAGPAPVGSFDPNAWGLSDMAGNVWEWCWDRYDGDYYAQSPGRDPAGPDRGARRVLRGGSWAYQPVHARVANRYFRDPSDDGLSLGFRLARSAPSES